MKTRPTLNLTQRLERLRARAGLPPKTTRYVFRLRTGGIFRIPLPTAKRLGLVPGNALQWTMRADGRSAEFKIQQKSETPRRHVARQLAFITKIPEAV